MIDTYIISSVSRGVRASGTSPKLVVANLKDGFDPLRKCNCSKQSWHVRRRKTRDGTTRTHALSLSLSFDGSWQYQIPLGGSINCYRANTGRNICNLHEGPSLLNIRIHTRQFRRVRQLTLSNQSPPTNQKQKHKKNNKKAVRMGMLLPSITESTNPNQQIAIITTHGRRAATLYSTAWQVLLNVTYHTVTLKRFKFRPHKKKNEFASKPENGISSRQSFPVLAK
jgi:hypothetical protein